MRDDGRESSNVEDRRGGSGGSSGGGGIGGLLLGSLRGKGIVAIIVAAAAAYFFDIDPALIMRLLNSGESTVTESSAPTQQIPANDKLAKFVSVVLADTEDVWRERFAAVGKEYRDPKLVLFRGSTPTPCGKGKSAMGPFYCPADQKVYIDLSFYQELKSSYRAPGDFAQAYVIGHEVGHHVQNLLGTMRKVRQQQEGAGESAANALSVKMELQADCYAGVWAHHAHKARQILEEGDIEEAMTAASAIGDDTLQKRSGQNIQPESFTHGSSAERVRWFKTGMQSGELKACDTFL
ncbi:KPN_02809 family neutral zinc metallopeptidase [Turneriella parva]|uniref:Metalloprotease n=1 Tax=Turneriella parva (strain ATCC BAA-1111 / DSM 21527 / NCTC 11395 / H) TaxID=869212 RepID=I4B3T4_TURPD|nr:neutral zinc metallopeptidase [Turneriella parva]AFM11941.1 protein of unknown function zinc metallopeptidase [Turneriella parva DSM 21527]